MNLANVIKSNKQLMEVFSEYVEGINRIEDESDPDVIIENCRALIEGIAKKIVITLDESETKKTIDKKDFPEIIKQAINIIPTFDPEFGIDFSKRAIALVLIINDIRNKRGKISHGKIYPLDSISEKPLSDLVISITDGILIYMLMSFSAIKKEIPQAITAYEENEEFNEYLDETNQIPGIKYSKALYDQDYDAYIERLKNYTSQLEEQGL